MNFAGRHIVITGASTGIGRATAERIAAGGGKPGLIARREGMLRDLGAQLNAGWAAADVGDKAQLIGALDALEAQGGPIDGLFLNAGTGGAFAPVSAYGDAMFDEVMRVNTTSLFWAIAHVLPGMMARRRGAILITGSLASVRGMAANVAYVASKHAAQGIARAVAMEAAPFGVRCNCLLPGFIETPMLADVPEAQRPAMAARVPQGRIGTAAEAAAVAAFLLSDDASHVTAQSWAADGGILGTLSV
ncbi:SDR family NAD(P)-dependent oxidoreductase [Novosphingobium sediminicola]|uniref:NAD(P)-dependent dehydrogenase (Short-subunit alcohol dehydrogenase family) n=1 Tax=Novosphingobium sediminicola TaxID=563162 RepID=A0A7W6G919_9SPHN|nr:SDR family NAD(P)-dependent oxidoreductase [Novosphingobium sediminicola]MBB3956592.1 NAD(P)-dependent dehydrogenase (short-subunit alcohol dehydrogenase family) [Novosphingobium sediminicola]